VCRRQLLCFIHSTFNLFKPKINLTKKTRFIFIIFIYFFFKEQQPKEKETKKWRGIKWKNKLEKKIQNYALCWLARIITIKSYFPLFLLLYYICGVVSRHLNKLFVKFKSISSAIVLVCVRIFFCLIIYQIYPSSSSQVKCRLYYCSFTYLTPTNKSKMREKEK